MHQVLSGRQVIPPEDWTMTHRFLRLLPAFVLLSAAGPFVLLVRADDNEAIQKIDKWPEHDLFPAE